MVKEKRKKGGCSFMWLKATFRGLFCLILWFLLSGHGWGGGQTVTWGLTPHEWYQGIFQHLSLSVCPFQIKILVFVSCFMGTAALFVLGYTELLLLLLFISISNILVALHVLSTFLLLLHQFKLLYIPTFWYLLHP